MAVKRIGSSSRRTVTRILGPLDITELCSGLPDREDRLSCIRDAGISVPDDYDELFNEE